ncbi:hypothetical protein FQN60_018341 [Etheostoma spectabile]|uniref:Uncharacterized protein n=1 Tax=Etheostoma spectabile TaxID=54343 RepID=A0A5J5DHP1_9PERO|nr:hypothetical protein FQN60_018341 [Etheostoma spectabile]
MLVSTDFKEHEHTWVIFSLLALGLSGASVNRTGCSSGATRSSFAFGPIVIDSLNLNDSGKHDLTFSMSSQLVTMPCSMGYFRVRMPLLLWASSPT